ncbi:hypothetical protein HD554DRAFT_1999095, partial [Boletus coccyginus]
HGDRPIDGAVQVLDILRKRGKHNRYILTCTGKHPIFVTNDARQSRKSYKGRFDQLGIQATVDEIYGSAHAAAVYISSVMKLPQDKKV